MKKKHSDLPIQKVVTARGSVVSYIEKGEGPPLIIVPGLFQNVNGLRHLIIELSQHFRVICLAVPGSEGSSFLPAYTNEAIGRWVEEALESLGVRKALFVSVSLGAILVVSGIVAFKRVKVLGYVAHEPVTRLTHTRVWWRLLYQTNRLLYERRLGFLSLTMIWVIRFVLAHVFRQGFARALLGTPVRVFPPMGDVLSEQPTDELAVAAAKKVPTLVVLSSERTRGLIEQEQMMRAVGRMSVVGLETLSGAKHFLRREDQRNLARHVVGFARRRRVIL